MLINYRKLKILLKKKSKSLNSRNYIKNKKNLYLLIKNIWKYN